MDDLNHTEMKHTRSIPILVDNSLNRAMSLKYGIFSLFGLVGVITHIPAIAQVSGETVATIVAVTVMISSGLASLAAWHTERGQLWQKVEIYSAIALVSFSLVYSITLLWLAISGGLAQAGGAVIAIALLVMPIWRIRYLIKRVAANN